MKFFLRIYILLVLISSALSAAETKPEADTESNDKSHPDTSENIYYKIEKTIEAAGIIINSDRDTFSAMATIRWKPVQFAAAYEAKIVDKNEKIIAQQKTTETSVQFRLIPGDYHFMVRSYSRFEKAGNWSKPLPVKIEGTEQAALKLVQTRDEVRSMLVDIQKKRYNVLQQIQSQQAQTPEKKQQTESKNTFSCRVLPQSGYAVVNGLNDYEGGWYWNMQTQCGNFLSDILSFGLDIQYLQMSQSNYRNRTMVGLGGILASHFKVSEKIALRPALIWGLNRLTVTERPEYFSLTGDYLQFNLSVFYRLNTNDRLYAMAAIGASVYRPGDIEFNAFHSTLGLRWHFWSRS